MICNKAISAAVEWWTNRISGKVVHDNGDNSFGSIFAGLLADDCMIIPDREALDEFRNQLTGALTAKANRQGVIFLDCDYSPDLTLRSAANEAGIPPENFPWKTQMRLDEEKVIVSGGYGRPFETVWSVNDCQGESVSD